MRTRIAFVLLSLIALNGCGVQDSWNMLKSRRVFKQANLAYASRDYETAIDLYNAALELDKNPDPRVLVTSVFYRGRSHHRSTARAVSTTLRTKTTWMPESQITRKL